MNLDRINLRLLYVYGEFDYSVYKERLSNLRDDLGYYVSGEALYSEPLPHRVFDALQSDDGASA
jgi:hypothetical protein